MANNLYPFHLVFFQSRLPRPTPQTSCETHEITKLKSFWIYVLHKPQISELQILGKDAPFSTCPGDIRLHTLPTASCLLLASPAWLHIQHHARLSRSSRYQPVFLRCNSSTMLRHFAAKSSRRRLQRTPHLRFLCSTTAGAKILAPRAGASDLRAIPPYGMRAGRPDCIPSWGQNQRD